MDRLFPDIADDEAFERVRKDDSVWRPVVAALAERNGLTGAIDQFLQGSVIVYGVGEHVIKLHEPWNRVHFTTEARCLSALSGQLPIPSPRLFASGELEGWGYLIMERLAGQPLSEMRAEIPEADLVAIATDAGRLARAIQARPLPPGFARFSPWPEFIADQRRGCLEYHRRAGLSDRLLATIEEQLAAIDLVTTTPVLLHTELTDTNLMVDRVDGRWRLSGVFDFEPSMSGHPLYDLPAITIFVAHGEPELCRAALGGFGVEPIDDSLRAKLLACTILHRYSHFGFFLSQVGVEEVADDWSVIARQLYGF